MLNMELDKVIDILRNGGVVILPSESCYGISCLASSQKVVERIHAIKQEPSDKPTTLLVNSIDQISEYGMINDTATKLSQQFHPGQLNLVIDKRGDKYNFLSQDGIAFRVPDSKLLLEILSALGEPITTTSANIHKKEPIYKEKELDYFENKVDYIYRVGDLDPSILTSTVYDTRTNSVIRQGSINVS